MSIIGEASQTGLITNVSRTGARIQCDEKLGEAVGALLDPGRRRAQLEETAAEELDALARRARERVHAQDATVLDLEGRPVPESVTSTKVLYNRKTGQLDTDGVKSITN